MMISPTCVSRLPSLRKERRNSKLVCAFCLIFLLCGCSTYFASIPQTTTPLTWDDFLEKETTKSKGSGRMKPEYEEIHERNSTKLKDDRPQVWQSTSGRDSSQNKSLSRIVNIQPTLLPWEVDAIMSVNLSSTNFTTLGDVPYDDRSKLPIQGGVCTPPDSYNQALRGGRCCTGATSSGGGNKFARSIGCAIGPGAWEKLRMTALETMNNGSLTLLAIGGENDFEKSFYQCDVCRIVDIAMKNNYSLAFTGDSLQRQLWDGFICELSRSGYNLQYNGMHSRPQAWWKRGVGNYEEIIVPSDQNKSISIRFYQQYMPLEGNMTEIKEISEWSDILVFNFGVHYLWDRHQNTYRDEMTAIMNEFKQHSFALLASRETSAQHFPNPGGEFIFGRGSHYLDCNLNPNTTGNNIFGWRERILNQVATNLTYRVLTSDGSLIRADPPNKEVDDLFILPFLNFTRSLGYLHAWQVGSQGSNDCTHFCTSPFLWMPLWRSLRIGLEYKERSGN